MRRALSALVLVSVAFACLFASLYNRARLETLAADKVRADSDARATAALSARDAALAALVRVEAESRLCSSRVASVERAAVEQERASCDVLIDAASAGGRLDVEAADLSAVVSALRGRRRKR